MDEFGSRVYLVNTGGQVAHTVLVSDSTFLPLEE